MRRTAAAIMTMVALAWLSGCGGPECQEDEDCDDQDACTRDTCGPEDTCLFADDSARCDDQNPCTDNACQASVGCVITDNEDPCDDGNACTLGDTCTQGGCRPGPDAPDCDDQNPCTDDSCDSTAGCVTVDNLDECNDNDACTENDVCGMGACAGSALVCDDANPCTDDSCNWATGCVFENNTSACDDADACTLGDECALGDCIPGSEELPCDDENPCTDDWCNPASGCVFDPNSLPCDDGSLCTLGDACADSSCQPGADSPDCDDQDACTQDGCDPLSGCTNEDISDSCNDGDGCTRDSCDPATGCVNLECSPYGSCQDDACSCLAGYTGDGFDCEPVCDDGMCVPGETAATCRFDCDFDLVIVVESALAATLQASLDGYLADILDQGYRGYLVEWTGGSAVDLRSLLADQVAGRAVEGTWLLGDLPVAWYQQVAFGSYEEFPFDLYLMDLDADFADTDGDRIYDSHSTLDPDIYVSRLDGDPDELLAYFARVHSFRVEGPALPTSAFNFMDDEWAPFSGTYGLEYMYTELDLVSDPAESTRDAYLSRLTGDGVEFVFQWIHSSPTLLHIYGTGEGTIDTAQIRAENHKAAFLNLFNCSAARFTEECLGMTYLAGTDWGLAAVGTTKVGGMVLPRPFHEPLGQGEAWGPAFLAWFRDTGVTDDEWYLGMVALGDPLLGVSVTVTRQLAAGREPAPDLVALRKIMKRIAQSYHPGTFAEYRIDHPESG